MEREREREEERLFVSFMYMEKVLGRIYREKKWKVLQDYEVEKYLVCSVRMKVVGVVKE